MLGKGILSMKAVLFVANTSWFLYNFRLDIMLHMKDNGYQVYAVAPVDQYTEKIKANSIDVIDIKIDRKGKNVINDLFLILGLKRIYQKYQPEIIHHFTIKPSIYGTIAARMAKVPRIANSITGLGHVFIDKGPIQILVKRLYKSAFNSQSVRVIFENPDDRDVFISNGIIREDQAFLIYGNGVDSAAFSIENSAIKLPSDIQKDENQIIFSLFARMIWNKGIREFVEAAKIVAKKNANTRFYLFGGIDTGNPTGVPRKWLEEVSHDDRIQWMDQVDDVKPYLKIADVVVLPSAYKEGVPQALIEAASMSKPIITTDVSGCREIVIHNKNGLIVPPKNIQKLAEAMLELAGSVRKRSEMGRAGRKIMLEKFDGKLVIMKTKAVYFS